MSPSCPIHILLCTDSRYAPHCGVTATSALENAGGLPVEIHIFTDSLTAEDTLRFKSLERKYDCHINIKVISGQCVDRLPKNIKRWPPSSFMRLLAAELLPADIHRVIYLDCDTAVDTPLQPLWQTQLGGNMCAVVPDGPDDIPNKLYKATLDVSSTYFNSGVMVLDLDMLRENGIFTQALNMLETSGNAFRCPDQDVLNLLIDGKALYLPIHYNIQSSHLLQNRPPLPVSDEHTVRNILRRRSPSIIHYTSEFKPWACNINHWHPLRSVWHRYRHKSPWHDRSPLSWRTRFAIWRLSAAYRLLHTGPFACIWK